MANPADIRPDASQGIGEMRDGIALTSALALDRRAMLEALQLVVDRATEQPRAVIDSAGKFVSDLVSITFGSSKIEPAPKDARFKDDSWRDNPVYRRLGQAYLAWGKSIDEWLAQSKFDDLERERARFMLDIMKDLAAPMNTLPGNPEACASSGTHAARVSSKASATTSTTRATTMATPRSPIATHSRSASTCARVRVRSCSATNSLK